MKKLLISIGSLLILVFVVVLFINATESKKDSKKAKTEVTKTEASAPCSATCNHPTGDKTITCDPATCTAHKDGKCDPATCTAHKDGKCDPSTCTAHKDGKCDPTTCTAHKEGGSKPCNPITTGCPGTCHSKTTEGNK